jgi:OmpA-OmpF porin, OOP family
MRLTLLMLCSGVAFAQASDEWNTFPASPQPPPANQTPPVQPKAPDTNTQPVPEFVPPPRPAMPLPRATQPRRQSESPAPSTVPPAVSPRPSTRPSAPAATAPAFRPAKPQATVEDDSRKVLSRKEKFLPGTEPHSPATYGTSIDEPGNARISSGQVSLGTLTLSSARLGRQGIVRVSLLGEYFNIANFPFVGATNIRSGVTFAASFQPFEWAEAFVGYSANANTNNKTLPNLIQTLGDLTLGFKASKEWFKGFHAGGELRLLSFSGVGNQGVDRFAVGIRPTLLAAYDFRTLAPRVPLIANAGIGFTFDGSGRLVTQQRLNAAEEFALNTNRFNRFNLGLSVEAHLPIAQPFVEYTLAVPLGVPSSGLVGPDGAGVSVGSAMASQLGLGVKVTALRDLTLLGAFQLGLARSAGLGIPATPPWNFLFGASFAIDPFQRGDRTTMETVREQKVEVFKTPPSAFGKVEGLVLDAETQKPVVHAIVTTAGARPVATDGDGKFLLSEVTPSDKEPKPAAQLDAGVAMAVATSVEPKATDAGVPDNVKTLKVEAQRDGYALGTVEVAVFADKTAKAQLTLKPAVKKGAFDILVSSKKKPLVATLNFAGASESSVTTEAEATAKRHEVVAGEYVVTVSSDGFLSQTRQVQISAGGIMALTFELVPTPKKVLVVLKGDRLEIAQQVHFATAKSVILADSYNLLQQVVDAVIKNGVKKLRIEGHTDNRGIKAQNKTLSEARAKAVTDYLTAQGIDKSRIESVGFGDEKPVAPNLTARGRELNRRVDFVIVEKE